MDLLTDYPNLWFYCVWAYGFMFGVTAFRKFVILDLFLLLISPISLPVLLGMHFRNIIYKK